MVVAVSTQPLRPFVVCAVLRGVTFTPARYASFIDLQDKLHQNICRRRTLVAIGTHDLAALVPPFRYSHDAPDSFSFVPLSQARAFTGTQLLDFYRTDPSVKHIKPYVDIIAGSPVLPIIRDAAGTVLSMPPLINGEASKISLATRDVFVEATATDLSKAHTVLNAL
jgi:phenylalanyl-tRNA synthetase beta chain